jgi:hypothetical protein
MEPDSILSHPQHVAALAENAMLREDNAALRLEMAKLREAMERLQKVLEAIQTQLAKDSHNSHKPPSSDGPKSATTITPMHRTFLIDVAEPEGPDATAPPADRAQAWRATRQERQGHPSPHLPEGAENPKGMCRPSQPTESPLRLVRFPLELSRFHPAEIGPPAVPACACLGTTRGLRIISTGYSSCYYLIIARIIITIITIITIIAIRLLLTYSILKFVQPYLLLFQEFMIVLDRSGQTKAKT